MKIKKTSFIGLRISPEMEQRIIRMAKRRFKGKKSKAIVHCITSQLNFEQCE